MKQDKKTKAKMSVQNKVSNVAKKESLKQSKTILVSRLHKVANETLLKKYFSQFGDIEQIRLVRCAKTGNSKRRAYIKFRHEIAAKAAHESTHNYLVGKQILQSNFRINKFFIFLF